MSFFTFSLLMLGFALIARFRCPTSQVLPALWFLLSWLPSELPWLFALFQIFVTIFYISNIFFSDFPITNNFYLNLPVIFSIIISAGALGLWYDLHKKTFRAKKVLANALLQGLGNQYDENNAEPNELLCITANAVSEDRNWLKPFSFKREGVERISDIAYGNHPQQQLDIIYQNRANLPRQQLRPVLLHVHGGAWMLGKKQQQALPLLHYLAQQGWICVDINYRLAPAHRYPNCIVDVKMAIAWVKANIEHFGGDGKFIAITGESAGGHLCALAALTANDPEFQPDFEDADTQVQAALPLYGIYDFANTSPNVNDSGLHKLLTRYVMPSAYSIQPEMWRKASPLLQITSNAPPMFIIQGDNDCLAPVEKTRLFVNALKEKSDSPVLYAEIEGAQHAFEIFHTVRTEFTIETIGKFLFYCYSKSRKTQP